MKGVSKEIYIYCFNISISDLQKIVQSSYNSERLVFRYCCIPWSESMDFSSSSISKIKFISFYNCGENKSDFVSNPACFENIVEAIAKSGIKLNLKHIDIYNCKLDKETIQKMFVKHGMNEVKVVETGAAPTED